jgi:hypothetical protein
MQEVCQMEKVKSKRRLHPPAETALRKGVKFPDAS